MTEQENTEVGKAVVAGAKPYDYNAGKAVTYSFMTATFKDDWDRDIS